jgi:thioesterase domain-containing protein
LYRSGDLARYRADGTLEFLGRRDLQVKVRGFRVELGEVEGVLAQHPGVREGVVVAREDGAGGRRLVGYAVPKPGQALGEETLRTFLKEKLPDYMVPAALVLLDGLPRTPGGKVDRAALPEPGPAVREGGAGPQPPRNEAEACLVKIWQETLGTGPVGVTDNFFDLGGHSLLAVRVFARIKQEFGKDLPLATLFQGGTVEHLARVLTEVGDAIPWATLHPIQPPAAEPAGGKGRRPLFVVSPPNVNSLGYALLARHLGPDQPVYGLQSRYRKDLDRPYGQAEHEALAAEYLRALQALQPQGPYLLVGMCVGSYVALEMARQIEAKGEEVLLLAVLDTWPVENTSNSLWYMHNALRCLRVLYRAGFRGQLRFLCDKGRALWRRARRFLLPGGADVPAAGNPFTARYWPGPGFEAPRFGGRITLFRTRNQPYYRVRDPEMGWKVRAARGVEVHMLPGTHRTMLREPNVQVLAARLRECLDKAQAAAAR